MKLIAPDYFPSFSCIAGACRHTCCAGWEIDIDEDTREYYRTVPGEIGKKLAENIDDSGEIPCFRMAEGMRCPFLNRDNLCELVLTLGEESLGQICSDHPRFRNFFSDRTEIGLGLTCEAAGRLILFWPDPVTLTESLEYEGSRPVYTVDRFSGMDGYDVYLSGAQALLTITCPDAASDKELIIFRDSYGSSLTPYLIGAYSKITMVDLRYIAADMIGEYVDFADQDVLFIYSTTLYNSGMLLK